MRSLPLCFLTIRVELWSLNTLPPDSTNQCRVTPLWGPEQNQILGPFTTLAPPVLLKIVSAPVKARRILTKMDTEVIFKAIDTKFGTLFRGTSVPTMSLWPSEAGLWMLETKWHFVMNVHRAYSPNLVSFGPVVKVFPKLSLYRKIYPDRPYGSKRQICGQIRPISKVPQKSICVHLGGGVASLTFTTKYIGRSRWSGTIFLEMCFTIK